MEMKDGFKRMANSGEYVFFTQGSYMVNYWDIEFDGRSIHYATAYNGGVDGDVYFMEIGGNTRPDDGITNPDTFYIIYDDGEDDEGLEQPTED